MSMPDSEPDASPFEHPAEPAPPPAPVAEPTAQHERPSGTRITIALIPAAGTEPPGDVSDQQSLSTWCAVSALWHPALLAESAELPRIESVESPSPPEAQQIRLVAGGASETLPSGYRTQAEDAGTILIDGSADRAATVAAILGRLAQGGAVELSRSPELEATAADFMALGAVHWWLKDVTVAMGHSDGLDHESLTRETLAGAAAWRAGDRSSATNRLRAAFELLTQARERFYPVDAYLIDICLLDPGMAPGVLTRTLEAHAPVTFLAPARAIENLAARDPAGIAALREAITEGWADVAGGAYQEADEPLLPLESIFWQFRKGSDVYRVNLDERNVETVARRRFGLYPQLPQIAKRFQHRFAVHLGFDAGRFPIRSESKRLWESPDGTSLETLTRPPLSAERPSSGVHLPWRIAQTMKDDHVATIGLVRWPDAVAPWYLDLRRVASYSPVLMRWVTLNDYFHLTDRPYETFRPEPDQYVFPYLAQAIARNDAQPITRRAAHARLRAGLDALAAVRAVAESISGAKAHPAPRDDEPSAAAVSGEDALETGDLDHARAELDRELPVWAGALARGISGAGHAATGRPGYLVFNPLSVPRRVPVLLPDAAPHLRAEGPLRAAQLTDEGVWGVVDLPGFGFAWVPREPNAQTPNAPVNVLSARDRVLSNESLSVEIDRATGGIRGLHSARESSARLGQQLVALGAVGAGGKPEPSRMVIETFDVEYAGPALVQGVSTGFLAGPGDGRLASFHQRYRLWSGRPTLELKITLSNLDPAWLERIATADPWTHALSCRWAWPDPNSMLRRTCLLSPEITEVDRPETPDVIDIATRRQRTALLFGGLAHHQRHGGRMLDTLLVAGRETGRVFELGVVLDLENPFHAAFDLVTPAIVVPTETGPPTVGPSGWLLQVDNKSVAVTRVERIAPTDDDQGWGIALHLVETAGHASRCRIRLFRNPLSARQTDFHREAIIDLPVDGDGVMVDLTPHEIARVEMMLG